MEPTPPGDRITIYLDVSCLCRPFDNQGQLRIRTETAAINEIFSRFQSGEWFHRSSQMAIIEIDATPKAEKRNGMVLRLPEDEAILDIDDSHINRGIYLETLGFKRSDAVHIAAAEAWQATVLLSCDDGLCKVAKRWQSELRVRVENPAVWVREVERDADE